MHKRLGNFAKFQTKIQVSVSRFSAKFQDSYQDPPADFSYSSKLQDVFPDPGRRSKKQSQVWWWVMGRLPWGGKSRKSCKIQFKIQVGVSRGNFKFHDFKLQFPSFKFQTKNQVRASSFIFKFQVSNQDTGQGFKLQFPIVKIQTKIQVRVSRCNFQVSIVKPRSRSGFRVAISKFQVSNQDPGRGFKIQFLHVWSARSWMDTFTNSVTMSEATLGVRKQSTVCAKKMQQLKGRTTTRKMIAIEAEAVREDTRQKCADATSLTVAVDGSGGRKFLRVRGDTPGPPYRFDAVLG